MIVSKHTPPFEEHHWGSSPLSERGGCCITILCISVGCVLYNIFSLSGVYIEEYVCGGKAAPDTQHTFQGAGFQPGCRRTLAAVGEILSDFAHGYYRLWLPAIFYMATQ